MYTGWEKSKANTFSLCEEGGETGYTAQEALKSVNSYNMGEGRTIRVWCFRSCIPRPSLVLSVLSFLGHHMDQPGSLSAPSGSGPGLWCPQQFFD